MDKNQTQMTNEAQLDMTDLPEDMFQVKMQEKDQQSEGTSKTPLPVVQEKILETIMRSDCAPADIKTLAESYIILKRAQFEFPSS